MIDIFLPLIRPKNQMSLLVSRAILVHIYNAMYTFKILILHIVSLASKTQCNCS